jgi:hypothetical protein
MRILAILTLILGLAACETTNNAPAEPSAELSSMIDGLVAFENARRGEFVGADIIRGGATGNGNTVTLIYEVRGDFARDLRRYPRGEVQSILRTYIKQQMCREEDAQIFFAAGGRYEMRFVDQVRTDMSRFTITGC